MKIVLLLPAVFVMSCASTETRTTTSNQTKPKPVQSEAKKEELGKIVREMYQLKKKAEADPALQKDKATRDRIIQLQSDARAIMNELTGSDKKEETLLMEEIMQRFVPEAYGEFQSEQPVKKGQQ